MDTATVAVAAILFIYLFILVSMFTWWLGGQHYLSRD